MIKNFATCWPVSVWSGDLDITRTTVHIYIDESIIKFASACRDENTCWLLRYCDALGMEVKVTGDKLGDVVTSGVIGAFLGFDVGSEDIGDSEGELVGSEDTGDCEG